ncbi:hypothetical protein RFI_17161 [Reticulomyxa filosa]|uniref:Uncharacterized protein n=1 Tax=Reticulomyxa filosa TaxID=46433 RepID=X6N419_RETFI|nr:hypothetical protein RFI_17161 [Reticulomyxa filosa]|eukprot:ETO20057.1 hypothetical protein RFI_17161 [Reticulomyxa filosa]
MNGLEDKEMHSNGRMDPPMAIAWSVGAASQPLKAIGSKKNIPKLFAIEDEKKEELQHVKSEQKELPMAETIQKQMSISMSMMSMPIPLKYRHGENDKLHSKMKELENGSNETENGHFNRTKHLSYQQLPAVSESDHGLRYTPKQSAPGQHDTLVANRVSFHRTNIGDIGHSSGFGGWTAEPALQTANSTAGNNGRATIERKKKTIFEQLNAFELELQQDWKRLAKEYQVLVNKQHQCEYVFSFVFVQFNNNNNNNKNNDK